MGKRLLIWQKNILSKTAMPLFNIIKNETYSGITRIINSLDRNPAHQTFGCLDRPYWYYRSYKNFPSSIHQTCLYGLAKIIDTDLFPDLKKEKIINWIKAGIHYWIKIQNKNGTYNEWYENEQSFCPTAFSQLMLSNFLAMPFIQQDKELEKDIIHSLEKSSHWLLSSRNYLAGNQMIAAWVGLYQLKKMGMVEKNKFESFQNDVLKMQNEEGWFSEYGGFDLGYSSLCLDLFSYSDLSNEYHKPIKKLIQMMSHFVRENWFLSGVLNSRNTSHLFPRGIFYFADFCPEGKLLASHLQNLIEKEKTTKPSTVDDWFFNYFYFNSFAMTLIQLNAKKITDYKIQDDAKPTQTHFKNAGIYAVEDQKNAIIVQLKKNGIVKKISESSSELLGMYQSSHKATDQFLTSDYFSQVQQVDVIKKEHEIAIKLPILLFQHKNKRP